MSVLSDKEIHTAIGGGKLVPGGDPKRATECSYSFIPGRAFLAGSKDAPVDFPGSDNKARVLVEPGRMIWIRTKESVKIPEDVVGFWWQTNSLSRKGLMLVNMSMVEPGYEGDLACLFVNFGKGNVLIESDTIVAKMVFVNIAGQVETPFRGSTPTKQYDTKLNELALEQPASFLQVGELAVALERARKAAIAEVQSAGAATMTQLEADFNSSKTQFSADLAAARNEAVLGFKNDIPGTLKKPFWWALAAVAALTAANLGATFIKDAIAPEITDVQKAARTQAEEVLRQRLIISGTPSSDETAILVQRIEQLQRRVDAMASQRAQRQDVGNSQ